MGTTYSPTSIQSGFESNDDINTDRQAVLAALEAAVSRDGTAPNFMNADFDLNDNKLLNVDEGTIGSDGVNLNQVIQLATDIANAILNTSGSTLVIDHTNSNPLTFNYGITTGSVGAATRTEFDLETLFGVSALQGITVVLNGVVQIPGASYTVTDGTLVTFSEQLDADTDVMFIYGDLSPTPIFSNATATLNETSDTATVGQTVFTAPTYVIAQNQLMVHIDGIMQSLDFGDYTETSTTTITLDTAMAGGERIVIRNIAGV